MATRPGFSLLEMLIVMAVMAVTATMGFPQMGRTLASVRTQRAATVVAAHVQLAHTTAARQRKPVRLSIDPAQKVLRIRDAANPNTIYAEQRFDGSAENVIGRVEVSDTTMLIYPSGMMPKQLDVRLVAGSKSRHITVTRAGQIWIQ